MCRSTEQLYADLYDLSVPDWPGEIDFYLSHAHRAGSVLEVACGTGRVALRLAAAGIPVSGVDLSPELLAVARAKTTGENPRWLEGDMRTFRAGEQYNLVIIPGHSFQFMLTPADQLTCLLNIRSHLLPGGRLIIHLDHQDYAWLAGLPLENGTFEPGTLRNHPQTGETFRPAHAWVYDPATQTATVTSRWERLGPAGEVLETWVRDPMPLHCVFRFEMEHLLLRAGYEIEGVYGDFFGGKLMAKSETMLWVAMTPPG